MRQLILSSFCFFVASMASAAEPGDRILKADLPHEMTHVIHFGSPLSRWADEGAAILSADDVEQDRNDKALRQILSQPGRFIPLRQLFAYPDYPKDVTALRAQGYSVTRFLVESKGRKTFLQFVAEGMRDGWDNAVKQHYSYANVDTAEVVWLQQVKQQAVTVDKPKEQPRTIPGTRNSQAPGTEVDRKLAQAFGEDCKEISEAMVKISLPHLILATNQITFEPGGRVKFAPCWCARFGKEPSDSEEAGVTTIYSDQACVRFDVPPDGLPGEA